MSTPEPMPSRTPERTQTGEVHVQVVSDSVFVGHQLSVEVRDAQMILQRRVLSNSTIALPPGAYQLSAVLEDGVPHTAYVNVTAGEKVHAKIQGHDPRQLDARDVKRSRHVVETRSGQLRTRTASARPAFDLDETNSVRLLQLEGARRNERDDYGWAFEGKANGMSVPFAKVLVLDTTQTISLPVAPIGVDTPNTCTLHFREPVPKTTRVSAWVGRERVVASALQNMYSRGELFYASEMAEDARELLRDKYSDPTAAALGALILKKVGRLAPFVDWVRNLARDFPWMPDGKIILASLLFESGASLDEAMELALAACAQRPLYAESFSLLLEMLRRWPKEGDKRREESLNFLNATASRVDWSSMCLNVLDED